MWQKKGSIGWSPYSPCLSSSLETTCIAPFKCILRLIFNMCIILNFPNFITIWHAGPKQSLLRTKLLHFMYLYALIKWIENLKDENDTDTHCFPYSLKIQSIHWLPPFLQIFWKKYLKRLPHLRKKYQNMPIYNCINKAPALCK